ncbi:hypothetical protein JCM10207_003312 [Rhodosporidiobolus poonsookiae]
MPRFSNYLDYEEDWVDDCCCDDEYEPYSTPKKKRPIASSKSPKTPSPKKGKTAAPVLDDKPFPFFDLPAELIDKILASPDLHLRDHLSLAASCKALRSAYYTPPPAPRATKSSASPDKKKRTASATPAPYACSIWRVLTSNRAFVGKGWSKSAGKQAVMNEADEKLLNHLWSREDRVHPSEVKVGRWPEEWEQAIDDVTWQRITKSTAKSAYKLNDTQLARVAYTEKRNPHSKYGAPMQLYNEAAVESVAFEEHGGALAHAALVKKREATAAKSASTRAKRKAGLLPPATPTKKSKTSATLSTPASASSAPRKPRKPTTPASFADMDCDEDEDDSDFDPYERSTSPTPVGPSGSRVRGRG